MRSKMDLQLTLFDARSFFPLQFNFDEITLNI